MGSILSRRKRKRRRRGMTVERKHAWRPRGDMKKKLSVCSLHVYIGACGRTCPLSQHIVSVGVQS